MDYKQLIIDCREAISGEDEPDTCDWVDMVEALCDALEKCSEMPSVTFDFEWPPRDNSQIDTESRLSKGSYVPPALALKPPKPHYAVLNRNFECHMTGIPPQLDEALAMPLVALQTIGYFYDADGNLQDVSNLENFKHEK